MTYVQSIWLDHLGLSNVKIALFVPLRLLVERNSKFRCHPVFEWLIWTFRIFDDLGRYRLKMPFKGTCTGRPKSRISNPSISATKHRYELKRQTTAQWGYNSPQTKFQLPNTSTNPILGRPKIEISPYKHKYLQKPILAHFCPNRWIFKNSNQPLKYVMMSKSRISFDKQEERDNECHRYM